MNVDGDRDRPLRVRWHRRGVDRQGLEGEGGVREAVSEGELRGRPLVIEPTIAVLGVVGDLEALVVEGGQLIQRPGDRQG